MEEKKIFYTDLKKLAMPIILQNLLSTAIGSIDTLMLNLIGQTELSAVSLANQLFFVLSLFFTGLTGSTSIMIAQYMSKQDKKKISNIFQIACTLSFFVCLCFSLLAVVFPNAVMHLLTDDSALIQAGSTYLRIVGISYLMMGFSQNYLASLKAMQQVRKSVSISLFTLILNFCLNAIFILGLFGVPKMGVRGVAIATCIARIAELLICVVDMHFQRLVSFTKDIDEILQKDFVKIAIPMTLQGFVWGGAMAVMSAIMGHLASDAVAANSVASVIQNIATVASFGLAEAGSILLGKDLGKQNFTEAKQHAGALIQVAVACGVIGCILMLVAEKPLIGILSLTPAAQSYFGVMYKILSVNAIFAAITYTMLCGVFPAGGDTRYGLYIDGIVMWSLVLLGSIAAFIWHSHPIIVFILLNIDELLKTPFVIKKYYKFDWVKNITRKMEDTQ